MRTIPLTKGKVTIVDDCDFEYLNQFKWHFNNKGYAIRTRRAAERPGSKHILMHSALLPSAKEVDHINNDGLDNRRSNLRSVTHLQNMWNYSMPMTNTSGYMGVTWQKGVDRWKAQIGIRGKNKYLGLFDTPEEASAAYEAAKAKRDGLLVPSALHPLPA